MRANDSPGNVSRAILCDSWRRHFSPVKSLFIPSARARCMTWHVNLRALQRCAVAIGANVLKFPNARIVRS